jgi:uncharacterized membrane protein
MIQIGSSVTIRRPLTAVYEFWRKFENWPHFMYHLQAVKQAAGYGRSHWIAKSPNGGTVEWDAEIVEERPNALIAWRSLPGGDVHHEGSICFREAPADRGTEIDVVLQYDATGGRSGSLIAKLLGEEPAQQIRDDLRRFKQVMETGEVVLSDGSLGGPGQGPITQRASQAPELVRRP